MSAANAPSEQRELLLNRLLRERHRGAGTAPGTSPADGSPPGDCAPRRLAVSLFFFSADVDDRPAEKYELVLEAAAMADALGLDAVWVPERHFDRFGAPYPAPAMLLAAIAARTRRIRLRAGSVVLPLHDPLLVAEEWGVLDAISHGRTGLSLASGWHADDFVLAPQAYAERKEVLREHLATMRTLWRGEPVERHGPDGRSVTVRTYPQPATPPMTWLTSSANPQTWRVAGELGLNVLTALLEQSVESVREKVGVYRDALTAAGHPTTGRQVTCMLHTHLAADPDEAVRRVRAPLRDYLSAHLNLFSKFASARDVGVHPDEVSDADRAMLLEHGVRRYIGDAGLFGSVDTCQPMIERLIAAGVTEIGCLVDFGLPREQVLECLTELGRLRERVAGR